MGRTEHSARTVLLTYLASIGIEAPIVAYPAHTSIEEGKRLRGDLAGVFTKNLLLRDKKGALFFVTAHEDTPIDLKTLHTKAGGSGRLGFATPQTLQKRLASSPGTITPLALHHDTDHTVTLIVDQHLTGADQLNFHHMTHEESIGLTWDQFGHYTHSTGHTPRILTLS